jgi:hypothetical protein
MKSGKITPKGNEGVEFGDVPDELRDDFYRVMAEYEMAEPVVLRDVLAEGGYPLPDPGEVSDAELPAVLEKLAEGLSLLRVYLESTNHLSDRELYLHLYHESLLEPMVIFPKDPCFGVHLDMIGSGSEEDCRIWLQYYADDEDRARWLRNFREPLPPKLPQPYDRDRFLPERRFDCFDGPVEN